MIFPEFVRNEVNSMKPSGEFFAGLFRRIFNKRKEKVFVIGYHKTGTSSLGKAMLTLGFRVCGSLKEGYGYKDSDKAFPEYLMEQAQPLFDKYDAFQDTPWFLLYKELYYRFPEAKFILTIRDEEKWIKSMQGHFGKNSYPYHDYIYEDSDMFSDSEKYIQVYKQHNSSVREFFKDKPKQLLEINLKEDDKWEKICTFLNVKVPQRDFPHVNKASSRTALGTKIKKFIKKVLYK
ncbi:hypothetical protein DI487_03455 [Flavobacterium sediminis]|uniref:Sulfotransferase family protein n=1 Tax=Flavobacterium sediminis TaxID=2201181 RepID=A0A2U8QS72_9FLAO|nr:sulfotransferase family protein [Flavobacterium sediminis]AWM13010.1 hypothetical protein DI487_03455 [Flavobacterium sediminis]